MRSVGAHSIPSIQTTFLTFQIFGNSQSINLPQTLRKVVGFKVHTVTWSTPPIGTNDLLLYICSPEICKNTANQSGYYISSSAAPNSFVQDFQKRDIVAVYNYATTESGIPNAFVPNFEQPTLWFDQMDRLDRISFSLETDFSGVFPIFPYQRVQIVCQFFLNTM